MGAKKKMKKVQHIIYMDMVQKYLSNFKSSIYNYAINKRLIVFAIYSYHHKSVIFDRHRVGITVDLAYSSSYL